MGNPTAKYIQLSDCIYSYINRANLTDAQYARLWAIGYEGLEMMNLDIFNSIKTRKLNVNDNKTVTLPGDCISVTKIGILNENGEVATLRENTNKTNYAALDSARLSLINDNNDGVDLSVLRNYYINFWEDGVGYNLFGARSSTNNAGEFKLDEENGVILLDATFNYDYLIVEYIAKPNEDEDVYLPIQAKQAVVSYVAWGDIEYLPQSRRTNLGEKQIRAKKYWNERRLAKMRINPVRLWIANDVIRDGGTLAVKG